MKILNKFIFGRTKLPRKRKRKLLVFLAAFTMFLGVSLQIVFKFNAEGFLLAGFGFYTFSELFD